MGKNNRKKIAIVGSGVVGRASGKGLAKKGHEVVFFDVNPETIRSLNESGCRAKHIKTISEEKGIDFFMLSVSTPTIRKRIRLRYLKSAVKEVGRAIGKLNNFPVVVIRSTVPPGTIEQQFIPLLEKISGKKAGEDFGITMNPEFLREASAAEDFLHPWLVVIGADAEPAGSLLGKLYEPFGAPIAFMPLKEAELMKYAHNLLNATKISFFNEMRLVGDRLGVDSDRVFKAVVKSAEAMWNPEYGTKNFGPFSGSCLPKDTAAFFTWALEKLDFEMPVLKGTLETNELLKKKIKAAKFADAKKKTAIFRSYHIVPVLKTAFSPETADEKVSYNRSRFPAGSPGRRLS